MISLSDQNNNSLLPAACLPALSCQLLFCFSNAVKYLQSTLQMTQVTQGENKKVETNLAEVSQNLVC